MQTVSRRLKLIDQVLAHYTTYRSPKPAKNAWYSSSCLLPALLPFPLVPTCTPPPEPPEPPCTGPNTPFNLDINPPSSLLTTSSSPSSSTTPAPGAALIRPIPAPAPDPDPALPVFFFRLRGTNAVASLRKSRSTGAAVISPAPGAGSARLSEAVEGPDDDDAPSPGGRGGKACAAARAIRWP